MASVFELLKFSPQRLPCLFSISQYLVALVRLPRPEFADELRAAFFALSGLPLPLDPLLLPDGGRCFPSVLAGSLDWRRRFEPLRVVATVTAYELLFVCCEQLLLLFLPRLLADALLDRPRLLTLPFRAPRLARDACRDPPRPSCSTQLPEEPEGRPRLEVPDAAGLELAGLFLRVSFGDLLANPSLVDATFGLLLRRGAPAVFLVLREVAVVVFLEIIGFAGFALLVDPAAASLRAFPRARFAVGASCAGTAPSSSSAAAVRCAALLVFGGDAALSVGFRSFSLGMEAAVRGASPVV